MTTEMLSLTSQLQLVSFAFGFAVMLLVVLLTIYLYRKEVKKKKAEMAEKLGFDLTNLQEVLMNSSNGKSIDTGTGA